MSQSQSSPLPVAVDPAIRSVQARFYVQEVTRFAYKGGWAEPAPQVRVRLQVVSGAKGGPNASWASATPVGEITMTIGNPAAAEWFDSMLGRDVAITFEESTDTATIKSAGS